MRPTTVIMSFIVFVVARPWPYWRPPRVGNDVDQMDMSSPCLRLKQTRHPFSSNCPPNTALDVQVTDLRLIWGRSWRISGSRGGFARVLRDAIVPCHQGFSVINERVEFGMPRATYRTEARRSCIDCDSLSSWPSLLWYRERSRRRVSRRRRLRGISTAPN